MAAIAIVDKMTTLPPHV